MREMTHGFGLMLWDFPCLSFEDYFLYVYNDDDNHWRGGRMGITFCFNRSGISSAARAITVRKNALLER
jgi:hypothetical protein